MSIRTNITTIVVKDYLELEEVANNLEERMVVYSKRHPDFSCVIEKHLDSNKIVVKSVYLEEHCN